jgi:response regulator RpfG family c-di-GMP phosphodiesterase
LIEKQKQELKHFNENLINMVNERTHDILKLQNAVILWAAEIIESRDTETGQHVE